jgi:hypothetical protein
MDEYLPFHPSLGPHEGKELELMLKNKKELALFYTGSEVPEEFDPYLRNGILHCYTFKYDLTVNSKVHEFADYIISNAIDNPKVFRLANLLERTRAEKFSPELEKEIGQLLGYNEEDIDYYIQHSLLNLQRLNAQSS